MRKPLLLMPLLALALALALAACGGKAESAPADTSSTPTVRMVTVQVGASSGQAGDTMTYTDPDAADGASTKDIVELTAVDTVTVPAGSTVIVEVDSQFPTLVTCWIANRSGQIAYDEGTSKCKTIVS